LTTEVVLSKKLGENEVCGNNDNNVSENLIEILPKLLSADYADLHRY
jgi:hypothetical protein